MSNHGYIKWWMQDWHGEPCLEMCSLAARGLWMEMLSLAHGGEPYGHVTIGGEAITTKDLARYARSTEKEVTTLLKELERQKVFSRNKAGVIYSRRMVKDHVKAEHGAKGASIRWSKGPPNGPGNGQTTIDPLGNPITPLQNHRSESDSRSRPPKSPSGGLSPPSQENILRLVDQQPNPLLRRQSHG